jgi:hypothetical protein
VQQPLQGSDAANRRPALTRHARDLCEPQLYRESNGELPREPRGRLCRQGSSRETARRMVLEEDGLGSFEVDLEGRN